MKKSLFFVLVASQLLLLSCKSQYQVSGIERTRVLVDNRYDGIANTEAEVFIAPFKHVVDSMMSPKVGKVARYMAAMKPESELSNLLADVLVWAGKMYNEKPVFGLYNMGGIRAALAEGDVTYGDVLDVAPFENKICFLTLTGERLLELFQQIASTGGEAVSHAVRMVITPDHQLKSVLLDGKPIDPKATYRLATIDYLAQGNDRMDAFKSKTDVNSPQEESNNLRYIIMDYFREQDKKGIVVDAQIEGRITIEN